ncbi:MAG: prepilin-type N-terminal cleavage/methylation domain-containing protein, partial [Candidatus Brocadiales bacterium]|nr:prepilin-type N-terminal cleavage/methylation domain-containing protein [Candidatus Bathyanammoxibius sp.]
MESEKMRKKLKCKSGFTLIEIVIVLAIIAVLAGILAPTLTRYVGDSRIRKAEVDVQHIGGAIALMYGDTGHWPI